ncbi:MAG TPA: aldehyde dehydrogenase family protein [Paenalcaligenes hominis]|uniref:aldehyde dehydrogenase (NAD(+)) n=1 Tax=Paenalcaligenes hominis TaxID=643674 RepID=A0A9D2VGC2_9BURK|nr:aldehyde dehydrogenase family protein [Paenalcaligenes hominis]NJB66075.1 aldehyde dehydrogenase (NAD+) [Paenalcaligenes hominis]GGE75801.1 aldehyde dehydrogenase [Paenalcaligenes hominis]HJH24176.1 aldehyde dehydrogenase family protein [Paenalcaligenes hominis]
MQIEELLKRLGVDQNHHAGQQLKVHSPIDGAQLAALATHSVEDVDTAVEKAQKAFNEWRTVPAPRRGELIRLLGEELRKEKEALGQLVSMEAGKIVAEGQGEVQEMIDICDFAVGLSRQLYGLTIASERPGHRMMESWHPLGVVGVITAFNFPVAVWSWNTALAIVCGNPVIWKPSEKTPLTALACQALFERALARFGDAPTHLSQVLVGERDVGERLVDHSGVALVSATGSTRMGREVGPRVAARFGRSLLELGGNNAIIVTPTADLSLAARGILFGAIGTAGQRCTTTRRLIVHESVADELLEQLRRAYQSAQVGNPLDASTLVGPLIDKASFDAMQETLEQAKKQGGTVFGGERCLEDRYPDAWYVKPALVEMPSQTEVVKHETFAPILYVMRYQDFDEAIAMQNDVPQGLSSAVFTNHLREAERFLSAAGSDCGIANVNIGTSGAEIGGAFGGEKETGGGRESGSDAWKVYMRRATNTINYSTELPLAQGIQFGS